MPRGKIIKNVKQKLQIPVNLAESFLSDFDLKEEIQIRQLIIQLEDQHSPECCKYINVPKDC